MTLDDYTRICTMDLGRRAHDPTEVLRWCFQNPPDHSEKKGCIHSWFRRLVRALPSWIYIDATRYALGRQSYQVGVTTEWLCANWSDLPDHAKQIITTDVEEAFEHDDRLRADPIVSSGYYPLGADIDRKCWQKVRALWRPNSEVSDGGPLTQDKPAARSRRSLE